jgi:cellulose synthase/poly-beta-1,6-N-acetylglucosamine synthase-like glycosyltransferase
VIPILFLTWTILLVGYAYAGYPFLLRVVSRRTGVQVVPRVEAKQWPPVTIVVPVHNERHQIVEVLDSLLDTDYPPDQRQILIVSDASSDGTDETVLQYADRGVELIRVPVRRGKTSAENYARAHVRGEIVVNTDASIRIRRDALKALVRALSVPGVGVASGRDVSVSSADADANMGESGYVGYEMWVRDLETRAGGIVGASGCLYAIRRELHMKPLPESLSRDFAAALVARECGFRAVSVPDAICYVPRAASLRLEYRRKVRTMLRGMQTLLHKRVLMNPFRHGRFAWMLLSHKACRWLIPWLMVASLVSLTLLAPSHGWARVLLLLGLGGAAAGALGWFWPDGRSMPRALAVLAYGFFGTIAALHAALKAVRGEMNPIWEPTRREAINQAASTEAPR